VLQAVNNRDVSWHNICAAMLCPWTTPARAGTFRDRLGESGRHVRMRETSRYVRDPPMTADLVEHNAGRFLPDTDL
jgi:hypothetical protein